MKSGSILFNHKKIGSSLKAYSKVAVLTDTNTRKHCYPKLRKTLPIHELIEVPAGEEFKNLDTCQVIWSKLTELNFDRNSLLIILGGGVLGDMGGFCAATFKRGIDFILFPTTLLSQVDASIGGKLGVDFNHLKNHIGVFQEPKLTIINAEFLNTLPQRELRSGFAEVIKHSLIADKKVWKTISSKSLLEQDWNFLVKHSVNLKKSITEKDPRESGLRKILNFGHTIGHALESYFLKKDESRLFHGEAIAMGMIMESFIAVKKGMLLQRQLDEITRYILAVFGKESRKWNDSKIIHLMRQDKKNKGEKILLALPKGIGQARWDVSVSEEELKSSFEYYRSVQT